MTIEKALNRLALRFTPKDLKPNGEPIFKNFYPKREDLEAVNFMIDWVDNQKNQSLKENQLFAKLYIYVYHKFLQYYGATVFDDIPQSELHKLLDKPLNNFYEAFTKQLNDNEIYEAIDKDVNINGDSWDLETVTDQLNSQLTEALNRY